MRMNTVSKKIIAALLYLAIVVAASSVEMACDANPGENRDAPPSTVVARNTAAAAQGTPDNWFVGKWFAMGVILTIKGPLNQETGTATMNFQEKSCEARGNYIGEDNGKRKFSPLTSQNGGSFCDGLQSLTVWKNEKNELSYEVTSGKGTIKSGSMHH